MTYSMPVLAAPSMPVPPTEKALLFPLEKPAPEAEHPSLIEDAGPPDFGDFRARWWPGPASVKEA
jgi:hypothetical protein